MWFFFLLSRRRGHVYCMCVFLQSMMIYMMYSLFIPMLYTFKFYVWNEIQYSRTVKEKRSLKCHKHSRLMLLIKVLCDKYWLGYDLHFSVYLRVHAKDNVSHSTNTFFLHLLFDFFFIKNIQTLLLLILWFLLINFYFYFVSIIFFAIK